MKVYTRDELAILLGIGTEDGPADFRDAIAKDRPETQQSPRIYELKNPVSIGEKRPGKYVAEMRGNGFGIFPSLQSARLWWRETDYWAAA